MASHGGPNVVEDGLILALDAGNTKSYPGSGTTWTDLIGSNDGTLTNGPTFNSANGGAIVFDGTDDYVISANNTNISGTSPRSLCAWCYPTTMASGSYYSVVRIGAGTNTALFEILIQFNSGAYNVTGHFSGSGQSFQVSADKILLNNYNNIVMTYSGSVVSIYVDGVLKASQSFTLNTTNNNLYVGEKTFSGHNNFVGDASVIHLYDRALTAAEVLQNYNAIKGRYGY